MWYELERIFAQEGVEIGISEGFTFPGISTHAYQISRTRFSLVMQPVAQMITRRPTVSLH